LSPETVGHKPEENVRWEVPTNNIENSWSLIKRGAVGTYHQVSKDFLPFYLAEFTFRHIERYNRDIFEKLISSCSSDVANSEASRVTWAYA
jgi:hypothetical protein